MGEVGTIFFLNELKPNEKYVHISVFAIDIQSFAILLIDIKWMWCDNESTNERIDDTNNECMWTCAK